MHPAPGVERCKQHCRLRRCAGINKQQLACCLCTRHESGYCHHHRPAAPPPPAPAAPGAELYVNRLQKFEPRQTRAFVFTNNELAAFADPVALYGWKLQSPQDRFLRGLGVSTATLRLLVVICSPTTNASPPASLSDPRIVAEAFGAVVTTRRGQTTFEVWHVGARANHQLNNSGGGTRWGFFPVTPEITTAGGPVRGWKSAGVRLTRTRHEQVLRGTPNPYACEALAMLCEAAGPATAMQNPWLPCAMVFASSHKTHAPMWPGVTLLYRALGFTFVGEGYVHMRVRDAAIGVRANLALARASMARGEAVVGG